MATDRPCPSSEGVPGGALSVPRLSRFPLTRPQRGKRSGTNPVRGEQQHSPASLAIPAGSPRPSTKRGPVRGGPDGPGWARPGRLAPSHWFGAWAFKSELCGLQHLPWGRAGGRGRPSSVRTQREDRRDWFGGLATPSALRSGSFSISKRLFPLWLQALTKTGKQVFTGSAKPLLPRWPERLVAVSCKQITVSRSKVFFPGVGLWQRRVAPAVENGKCHRAWLLLRVRWTLDSLRVSLGALLGWQSPNRHGDKQRTGVPGCSAGWQSPNTHNNKQWDTSSSWVKHPD